MQPEAAQSVTNPAAPRRPTWGAARGVRGRARSLAGEMCESIHARRYSSDVTYPVTYIIPRRGPAADVRGRGRSAGERGAACMYAVYLE